MTGLKAAYLLVMFPLIVVGFIVGSIWLGLRAGWLGCSRYWEER